MGQEQKLSEAFVSLADSLVADYDVADLLHRLADHCVTLLDIAAAGLMLADQRGNLQVVAASSETSRLLELFQLQHDQGPCLDCYRGGTAVSVPDVQQAADRWPVFAAETQAAGYHSVHALPMRLRDDVIGTLNLFGTRPGRLPDADARIGQALADVATIAILQERAIRHHEMLAEQLQHALTSRIVIEQAKGVLAERGNLDMAQAFDRLRRHARNTNTRLTDLARGIVDGTVDSTTVVTPQPRHQPPDPPPSPRAPAT
ncbi:GAF and ANTAR domain-containing protein [Frankia sp. CNm7]|uniref:GAF and ANTAR domain-containing protein n=1 Tax=Frankia nepalensis TaxID=1836974 RepID=A0A937RQP1_9ACTN|nr:GAF and ANTAR domain-containing protein [Frankia nepalensis]MBL7515145.1 GAF and ANTAR domain-containing protein [Frankia nepalensis]MBL7521281.1 GAF and ANTAR domain-containing protein [Frankia nepalensis]MBL7633154.1 GAF and ANTAR domain-containing protein [Frankia nepalensis]